MSGAREGSVSEIIDVRVRERARAHRRNSRRRRDVTLPLSLVTVLLGKRRGAGFSPN